MTSFFRKLRWMAERRSKEQELHDELQFHLDEEAGEREAQGFTSEDAQRSARRDLGSIALVQEDTRATWGWTLLEQFAQDVRYALRTMSANKLFTVLAVISLALGIGANTAIYSFMDAVLLRPLPVEHPESLVVLNWQGPLPQQRSDAPSASVVRSIDGNIYRDPDAVLRSGLFPYPAFELLRKYDSVFSTLLAYYPIWNMNASIRGQAEVVDGMYVSGEYFQGLGVSPAAGRPISPDDDRAGAPVAVVSHAFSRTRFENFADAVGQAIILNNVPFTIVGVAPPGFFGTDSSRDPDFFIPLRAQRLLNPVPDLANDRIYLDGNYYWLQMMGRLRPGVTLAGAQAALAPGFDQWVQTTATNDVERAHIPKLVVTEGAVGPDGMRRRYASQLYVLMVLVALILAVACTNIANLLLARSTARRREIGLRVSLGAGRFRVARQLLTESLVLALLGGVLGIFVGFFGIRFLTMLLGTNSATVLPRAELNWQAVGMAIVLSVATGLLFGLAPALRLTRGKVMPTLKEVRSGKRPSRIPSLSDALVVSQVMMSLLMLVAAGLFARTLANLQSVDIGFDRDNLLLFEVNSGQAGYRDAEMLSFYDDLYNRFRQIPGVHNISFSNRALFTAGFSLTVNVDGRRVNSRMLYVGPDFFSTMGIPITAGREIDGRDRQGSIPVAVVSELFANTYLGGGNPIGKRIAIGIRGNVQQVEVVGVAKDARYGGLKGDLPPVVYASHNHAPFPVVDRMTFELRTAADPLAYVNTVRDIVRDVNPLVPLANISSQTDQIEQTISQEIMFAHVCTAFAVLALTIACIGLYGTVAYNVARRTNEIGIRVALGAQRMRVVGMILQRVMIAVVAALALGLPFALKASRYVESFLYSMKPNDFITIASAVLILLTAALLAAFIPALRASRIDPLIALRHE